MLSFIKSSKSNVVAGYLIFSAIFSAVFALAFQDAMFLVFAIFILLAFILANAIDVGDINKDLASVGWSSANIGISIPLGVIGGIGALVLGSLVVNISLMTSLIPDLTSLAKFLTNASVISPVLAVSANLFAQWLVIAPSEESLSKIIAPFASMLVFGDKIIAFFIAILLWMLMHIPTFIMQGVGINMYFVLFILGTITTILFFMTNSIIAPIVAHGVFNSAVILSGASKDVYGILTIIIIIAVLVLVFLTSSDKPRRHA